MLGHGVPTQHDDMVEVTLIRGRVVVTGNRGATSEAHATTMEAGQWLLMGDSYPQPLLEPASVNATAWLSGRLVFNDTPLPTAVAQFNRYSTEKITIGNAATARLHASGVFRSDDSRAFIEALHDSYGVSAKRATANDLVLSVSTKPLTQRVLNRVLMTLNGTPQLSATSQREPSPAVRSPSICMAASTMGLAQSDVA